MFNALNRSKLLKPENVFACTVGPSSKQTLAKWHVLDPNEILATIGLVTDNPEPGDAAILALLDGSSDAS
jgi:trehalose 6-phosphate synthase/phosphatase